MILIFKCIAGLGNRLCNLMNMMYIRNIFPHSTFYLVWLPNPHCGAEFKDLFHQIPWVKSQQEYQRIFPQIKHLEKYATTSISQRTRWDSLDEWKKHSHIVSVSHHLYQFVPPEYCIEAMKCLQPTPAVKTVIQELLTSQGPCEIVHFRNGDLLTILHANTPCKERILETLTKLDSSIVKIEYSADIVNRPAQDVIRALGELYYYSGHCTIKGYCPYSWFSSWVFLLSKQYSKEYPIFNADILELILVT
jgi:hypothetical protein